MESGAEDAVDHPGRGRALGTELGRGRAPGPRFRLAALVDDAAAAREWASAELGVPAFRRARPGARLGRCRRGAARLAAGDPPAARRGGARRRPPRPLREALRAEPRGRARAVARAGARAKRHVMVSQNYRFRRQSRGAPGARRDGHARAPARHPHRPAAATCATLWISPRDWRGTDGAPVPARHGHPPRRHAPADHRPRDRARSTRAPGRCPTRRSGNEPAVEALLTLDDGTPVAYEGTWAARPPETSWNGDWELVGEKARATWSGGVDDALRGSVHLERYGSKPSRWRCRGSPAVDRLGVLHELRRAVVEGRRPRRRPRTT